VDGAADRTSPTGPESSSPIIVERFAYDYPPDVAPWRRRLGDAITPRLETGFGVVLAHWSLVAALASALLLLGAYLSPLLKHLGYESAGQALFTAYRYICAQTPSHSYYPWGYQAAFDQRMTAIYGSFIVAAVAFQWRRDRLRPLSWRLYLLLLLPMALDGFTQMFGWRESNWELRTLTGTLFAVATVLAFFPRVDRFLSDFPG